MQQLETALQRRVADWLHHADVHAVGFYFPIRGEPDLRAVIGAWLALDSRRVAALPVINGKVLAFHAWTMDSPMRAGDFGIPVPAQGRAVQPECLLIPCLGFDAERFRLGYGGGYYDRTLAVADTLSARGGHCIRSGTAADDRSSAARRENGRRHHRRCGVLAVARHVCRSGPRANSARIQSQNAAT